MRLVAGLPRCMVWPAARRVMRLVVLALSQDFDFCGRAKMEVLEKFEETLFLFVDATISAES